MAEMEFKGTPGPWIADNQTVYALDERGEVNRFSCNMQQGYRVHSSFQKVRTDDAELVANARLMAAAPALLITCEGILDALSSLSVMGKPVTSLDSNLSRKVVEAVMIISRVKDAAA